MSDDEIDLTIGQTCHDDQGDLWVYIGYRITSVNTKDHGFVRAMSGYRGLFRPPWTYYATRPKTIYRKFPDLLQSKEEPYGPL